MENILIGIIVLLLGLTATIGNLRQKTETIQIWFIVLSYTFVGYYSFNSMRDYTTEIVDKNPLYISISILFITLIFAHFTRKEKFKNLAFVSFLLPLLYLMLGETSFVFNAYGFTTISLLKISYLGVSIPLLLHFCFYLFNKFNASPEKAGNPIFESLETSFLFLFLAISSISGYFLAGPFGLFIFASSYLSSTLLFSQQFSIGQRQLVPISLSLLLLFPIHQLSTIVEIDNLSLLQGKVISGLFFGGLVTLVYATCLQWTEITKGRLANLLLFKALVIPSFFIGISGGLYFIYESFGGSISIIAILIGAAISVPLTNVIIKSSNFGSSLLLIGSAILFTPYLSHQDQVNSSNELTYSTASIQQEKEIHLSPIHFNSLEGNWKIDEKNTHIGFTLSANGTTTKGKFKSHSGSLTIPSDWKQTTMSITIPVNQITTFNRVRDASILEDEDFFDENQFKEIQFSLFTIEENENAFIGKGEFTMKGISKPLTITLQANTSSDEQNPSSIWLTGSGELNRLDFGMKPDPAIGNVISFEFKSSFNRNNKN
jgi:polyisoprenoid-binding protein YceI